MPDIVPGKNTRIALRAGHVLLQPTAANRSGRREYECVFMQPGRVKQADQEDSNWLIPADVIRSAQPLFNSLPSYLDHPELFGFGWHQEPKIERLVGVTFDARWSDAEGLMAGYIRLYDRGPGSPGAFVGTLMDQILDDRAKGLEVPPVGLSAVFFHDTTFDEEAGLRVTTAFRYIESIDFVYDAGAGGYIRTALAAAGWNDPPRHFVGAVPLQPYGGVTMPPENDVPAPAETPPAEAEALATIRTVAAQVESLTAQVEALSPQQPPPEPAAGPTLADLNAAIEHLTAQVASQEEPRTIEGMGQPVTLTGGRGSLEQVEAALDAMINGTTPPRGVAPLTGIRELYHLLSGDFEMTGLYQAERVYLANVNCATMAGLVANALNKRVVNMFQEYPRWWEKFISPEDFSSLQQVKWITLGGIGELPTVEEGAAYTELAWDDQTETADFVKKGGYLGITIEAIDKDDTAKLRAAPRALAQAGWLTLSKAISAIFTANSGVGPTLSDSKALFHTDHSNLGTTALSHAAYVATRLAMRKQTELNSSERLGALTAPKYLLVPSDLEFTALQALATEQVPVSADWNENPFAQGDAHDARMRAARDRVIVVDLWTDTNNWAAVANPQLYPSVGLAFRYGRTPEIFSVASPTAGLMFSNDTMPIKVRFFFATGPTDYRGLYKHNVA